MVWALVHPASSFGDLAFLTKDDGAPIPKFLVFFDNTKEAEAACKWLKEQIPVIHRSKVTYFHSTMIQNFCKTRVEWMKNMSIVGFCCTDGEGMGLFGLY